MAGAVGGAIHLSKQERRLVVLIIDNLPNNDAALGPLRDLGDALGRVRGCGDGSDGVRLRQRVVTDGPQIQARFRWRSRFRPGVSQVEGRSVRE